MLIELRASLNLVKRNDDVLEEGNMLVTERDRKSRNNGSEDVEEFSSTVKFMRFVNK